MSVTLGTILAMSELKVQLDNLKAAGVGLQKMGAVHTSAHETVSGCDPSKALQRPAGIGVGSDGFLPYWNDFKDTVLHMLSTNADSLHDCGQALIWCADALFPQVDDDTSGRFRTLESEITHG